MAEHWSKAQRRVGREAIAEVKRIARHKGWGLRVGLAVARMVIMAGLDESDLLNLASTNVPPSMNLPNDGTGSDHDSVGFLQQRVGWDGCDAYGWGTVADCMTPRLATRVFVRHLESLGFVNVRKRPRLWLRIERVQISFDSTGMNYEAQRGRSWTFLRRFWATTKVGKY